jgi:UDP-2-acetamido-3-amino-2,3-dideoxy-glucuronate N-acetyltransferase
MNSKKTYIDSTAIVEKGAVVGQGTSIWNWTKVRQGAHIGENCIIGQGVHIDFNVSIGAGCKVQNGAQIYHGVNLKNHVFIGPNVTFTNDLYPRADNKFWNLLQTTVEEHASIGAAATILCGITIGRYAMIGAGATITQDVPPHALVLGKPAEIVDYVDAHGTPLNHDMAGPPPSEKLLMPPVLKDL